MSLIDEQYLIKILDEETDKGHPMDRPYYEIETGYYEGTHKSILEAMKTVFNIAITKAGKCKDKNEIEKLRL